MTPVSFYSYGKLQVIVSLILAFPLTFFDFEDKVYPRKLSYRNMIYLYFRLLLN